MPKISVCSPGTTPAGVGRETVTGWAEMPNCAVRGRVDARGGLWALSAISLMFCDPLHRMLASMSATDWRSNAQNLWMSLGEAA